MSAPAITVGMGSTRPQGRRCELSGGLSPTAALLEAVGGLGSYREAWWSPHVFENDYRAGEHWQASVAIVLDLDRPGHTAWEDGAAARATEAIQKGDVPGSFGHPTPHGMRIVLPLTEPATDREAWQRAAAGACALAGTAIARLGLPLKIDTAATLDIARMFWAPRAEVNGFQRSDDLFGLSERTWTLAELEAHAPVGAIPAEPIAEPIADRIGVGERHETAKREAARLRRAGWEGAAIYGALHALSKTQFAEPSPDDELRSIAEYFDRKAGNALAPANGPALKLITFSELMETPLEPLRFLINKLIPEGGLTILSAQRGRHKTWLGDHAGICVASGRHQFLGKFDVQQGPVLILQLEGGLQEHLRRIKALCAGLNITEELPLYTYEGVMRAENERDREWLLARIAEVKPRLVVLDHIRHMFPGQEDDSERARNIEIFFRQSQAAHPAAWLCYGHLGKNVGRGTRGSSGIEDIADSVIYLDLQPRTKPGDGLGVLIHDKLRNGCELGTFDFQFVGPEKPGGAYLVYQGERETATAETKEAAQFAEVETALAPSPMTRTQLAKVLNISPDALDRRLAKMGSRIAKEPQGREAVIRLLGGAA